MYIFISFNILHSLIFICYNFFINTLKKDCPQFLENHPKANPVSELKEGCHMIIKGIKCLIKSSPLQFTGFTINVGNIGLNFAGGSS